jgi:hypothetical protein
LAEAVNNVGGQKVAGLVPGAIERVEACRVLLQSFAEVDGQWLLVLDARTEDETTRLWLETIAESVSMPSMKLVDVCYRMQEAGEAS